MKPYKTAITIELKEVTQTITAVAYRLHDKHSAQDNKLMTSYHLVPQTAILGLPLCLVTSDPYSTYGSKNRIKLYL